MEENYGAEKTKALAKLPMSGALTQNQAMQILKLVYPNVPEPEIIRTAILCRDFGLHPLMKEVYIIGFKNKVGGIDYSTVIGISASRKMAADRKGAYSFLDDTPRAATHEEIVKQYGQGSEEERDNIISICKLKGEQGNEATGFGLWPKNKEPYGGDKGNTKRNMANIRSERPTYNRLPGAALPPLEVIDEAYAEVPDIGKVDKKTGEVIEGEYKEVKEAPPPGETNGEHWCEEHGCAYEKKTGKFGEFYAHKIEGGWCNEKKKKAAASKPEPEQEPLPEETQPEPVEGSKPIVDLDWLRESLKTLQDKKLKAWSEISLLPYMKTSYKVDAETVLEAAAKLDKGQAAHFVKRVQETLELS